MDAEKREQLKNDLRNHYGASTEIAQRAEVHHSFVYLVLKGKRKSSKVLTIACEVLAEREKKEAEHSKKQLQLIEQAKSYATSVA